MGRKMLKKVYKHIIN